MELIRVVVVDDQSVIRTGLRLVIDHAQDMTVVGEAADGVEAVDVVSRSDADVVLMDIRMPVLDGLEATRRIVADERTAAQVLVLTTFDDDEYVFGALRAGAAGFLLKDATPDALLGAVRSVAAGHSLVDPAVTKRLVEQWLDHDGHALPAADPNDALTAALTDRELDVWRELASGASNREIGERLFVSEATVKSHVTAVLMKLGVRSRVQAVIAAYESGLVEPRR